MFEVFQRTLFTPQNHRIATETQRDSIEKFSVLLWNFCAICGVVGHLAKIPG